MMIVTQSECYITLSCVWLYLLYMISVLQLLCVIGASYYLCTYLQLLADCVVKLDIREFSYDWEARIWLVESCPRNNSDDKQQWASEQHSSKLTVFTIGNHSQ